MGDAAKAGRDGERDLRGRLRFGRALADALRTRGMKQEHLAAMLGTTQSSVSGWINGKYEPAAHTVFEIERSLGLDPGHLARPLGYLPVDASGAVSVESAIVEDPLLDDDDKSALLAVYRALAGHRPAGAEPERTAPATTGARRTRLKSAPVVPPSSRPRTVPARKVGPVS